MVAQNLFLCLLASVFAGVLTMAGKTVVVHLARKQKQKHVMKKDKVGVTCWFIFFMGMANVCVFFAPWFGPISIYWPTYIASQMVSNMVLIGFVLQHERFDKHAQVATIVVVTAVLFITINGPEAQSNQDIKDLVLGRPIACMWIGMLAVLYIAGILLLFFGKLSKRLPVVTEPILFLTAICPSALSSTASKAAANSDDRVYQGVLTGITWMIIILWTLTSLKEAALVQSYARFIPQMTFGSILLNAITGLIVWQDYEVVNSWPGYMTALVLLGLGVYLISDLDFIKVSAQDQQDFHRQAHNLREFFANIEQDLSRVRLERTLSQHQLTIIRRASLKRGASDPELGSKSKAFGLDDFDENNASKSLCETADKIAEKSQRSDNTLATLPSSLASLDSVNSLAKSLGSLRDLVGVSSGNKSKEFATQPSSSSLSVPFGDEESIRGHPDLRESFHRRSSGLLALSSHGRPVLKRASPCTVLVVDHLSDVESLDEDSSTDDSTTGKSFAISTELSLEDGGVMDTVSLDDPVEECFVIPQTETRKGDHEEEPHGCSLERAVEQMETRIDAIIEDIHSI